MELTNLPRLLYIGDVPVESTLAGAALIYRLLQKYPVSQLRIAQSNLLSSQDDKRLSNVVYQRFNLGSKRLLFSRFSSLNSAYLFLRARSRSQQFNQIVKEFNPQAVLTVAHGFSWLTAANLAKSLNLPLHLLIHDDWPSYNRLPQSLKKLANKQFAAVYQQARSRLCVSPYMMEEYQKRYGVAGSVLYPSRAADAIEFDQPPAKKSQAVKRPLVFAYAGSINSKGYIKSLVELASVLENFDSQLIIYSPLNQASIESSGLHKHNIIHRNLIPYSQLIFTLREEADVLFVPMSFDPQQKTNMQLSFPSKLTDYTAIGLPLLIWGPDYCSAVRWAQENPGVAEVVENENRDTVIKAVKKITEDAKYRHDLAKSALNKGQEQFSYRAINDLFFEALTQSCLFIKSRI